MTLRYAGDAGFAMIKKTGVENSENPSRKREIDAGLKPFTLVKYFSFSALGVILIFTLFLSWIISNHARNVMLKQSEDYSLLLAGNLNQQVFRRFVLPERTRPPSLAPRFQTDSRTR